MSRPGFIDAGGQGQHGWLRTLGTLGLTIAGAGALIVPVRIFVFPWLRANEDDMAEPLLSGILALGAGLIFAGAMAGLFLGLRRLHRRSIASVITAAPRFRWSHLIIGFVLFLVLIGGAGILFDSDQMKPLAFDPQILVFSLIAMLIGFGIQASAEEILFRGYIVQVAKRASRSGWAAATIGAALFAAGHLGYGVDSAVNSLITAVGLTLCVMLLGGLELAMGAHIANNLSVGFLFQNLKNVNANAPDASGSDWDWVLARIATMAVLVVVAVLLRRRSLSASNP